MPMLRKLALAEQKKIASLKADGKDSKDAEQRLAKLMEKITDAADAAPEPKGRGRANEVHLDLSEDELRAWRERYAAPTTQVERPCAVCRKPTLRTITTEGVVSYFCSTECQRRGWTAHLERVKKDGELKRAEAKIQQDVDEEDAEWDRETREMLGKLQIDVDFLGIARGGCAETGCPGYVQQRGAPRNIKPQGKECGVWSWNRVDHLACRRCGAPNTMHEDLSTELEKKHRKARVKATQNRTRRLDNAMDSEYYYATRGTSSVTSVKPLDSSPVAIIGGVKTQG